MGGWDSRCSFMFHSVYCSVMRVALIPTRAPEALWRTLVIFPWLLCFYDGWVVWIIKRILFYVVIMFTAANQTRQIATHLKLQRYRPLHTVCHLPSWWTRIAEAVMSVVTLKYGSHRSCGHEKFQVAFNLFVFSPLNDSKTQPSGVLSDLTANK